jgi:imidazolonepropionase-like amidohydrolase
MNEYRAQIPHGGRWGLRARRLFDGEAFHVGAPLVIVCEGRISGVDLTGNDVSADLPIVDLGDVTLLPGLIDAHVHLAFDPVGDVVRQMQADRDEVLLARMHRHAQAALRAGITTVRDLGDRSYLASVLRERYLAEAQAGPEILVAGPPITRSGGHCWFLGGQADTPEELAAAVAERAARGVDVIKVMATGGVITPGCQPYQSQYGPAELQLIADAAHRAGIPVTAHAHANPGIADAVAAGVDGIEHCFFRTEQGVSLDLQTVATLAETGVYVSTTTARPPGELPAHLIPTRENFARMHRAGVRLVCSSDAGVNPQKPHDCLPHGVIYFGARLGFTSAQALASVTSLAAQACAVGDRKGRIAPGYDADLLAVAGNPAADLPAILHPTAIYRAGHRCDTPDAARKDSLDLR